MDTSAGQALILPSHSVLLKDMHKHENEDVQLVN